MAAVNIQPTVLILEDWGVLDYQVAFSQQLERVEAHLRGKGIDTLILVEHPATVTLGRRASAADLRLSADSFASRGVCLQTINRGGLATAHEPQQLVAYPILALKKHDLRWYATTFLRAVVSTLADYGLAGELKEGEPGVWVNDRKICSFGIAVKKWVSCHGIALNVNNDLSTFETIIPCGRPAEIVTSMQRELGRTLPLEEVKMTFAKHFSRAFNYKLHTC